MDKIPNKDVLEFEVSHTQCDVHLLAVELWECLDKKGDECKFAAHFDNEKLCKHPDAKQFNEVAIQATLPLIKDLQEEITTQLFTSEQSELKAMHSRMDELLEKGLPIAEMQKLRTILTNIIKAKPHDQI